MGFIDRLQHAWNAFTNNRDPTLNYRDVGTSYTYRPDRVRFTKGNERSLVNAIFSKIANDVASINIRHVRLDDNGRYISDMKSGLNNCLTLEANKDQSARAFIYDVVASMLDEGSVAVVPIDTTLNPKVTDAYDIITMRTAKIIEWFPDDIKIRVYNDRTGEREDKIIPKRIAAIMENPFYSVMNEPNSTLARLVRKLNLLDAIDEQSGSGKLDLIIQLPYVVKTPARKQQAEERRADIERQLSGSKYGIAYTDGTERITQLNRPVENNLMKQIEYLTNMLISQLGMTQAILDGTADEKTMLNYNNGIIEAIVSTIVGEMKRKFLSKTARSKQQSIMFFKDPFRLTPIGELTKAADTLTRNEIMSKNEFRQILGLKPSNDPKADQLINSNINQSAKGPKPADQSDIDNNKGGNIQNE